MNGVVLTLHILYPIIFFRDGYEAKKKISVFICLQWVGDVRQEKVPGGEKKYLKKKLHFKYSGRGSWVLIKYFSTRNPGGDSGMV